MKIRNVGFDSVENEVCKSFNIADLKAFVQAQLPGTVVDSIRVTRVAGTVDLEVEVKEAQIELR
jgi:hypothetical protein